jgi:hypothetical protein
MSAEKVSRRNVLVGAASVMAAGSLPFQGLSPTREEQAPTPAGSARAAWMQDLRYCWGVMTHYLADWQARDNKLVMTVALWNKLIEIFDVEGMAKSLESVGAGHYQLSIGQNSGYYLSPNPVYDKITQIQPSKCSGRDLVADFLRPLRKRDIKLMVYLPSGAPGQDKAAVAALEWTNGPYPNKTFQSKWEKVINEWSRAGKRRSRDGGSTAAIFQILCTAPQIHPTSRALPPQPERVIPTRSSHSIRV